MEKKPAHIELCTQIVSLLQSALNQVVRIVKQTIVRTYFEIGRLTVEKEQKGVERVEYGTELLKALSKALTKELGQGFSVTNLRQMRSFYLAYQKHQTVSADSEKAIQQTRSDEFKTAEKTTPDFILSWLNYLKLMRFEDESKGIFIKLI
ncbi:MAG TPA: DUF1016 N-terminal domain-containing protein [Cryomorphaceae bacterium]|nr:DUF1016 N-terminal domain-containing protein [Cryomorphaceae bacterium]